MNVIDRYVAYIADVRRFSRRTVSIYGDIVRRYVAMSCEESDDASIVRSMNPSEIRRYQVALMDEHGFQPKTVNLHMSVLSGFCRFLVKEGLLTSNPVLLVRRPKVSKRLPEFYREEAMAGYLDKASLYCSPEAFAAFSESPRSSLGKQIYERMLSRLVVSILYSTGIRRSELISIRISDLDVDRGVLRVHGKGDKMREIPVLSVLCEEILLYLKAVELLAGCVRSVKEPLLVTYGGRALYPVYVDRAVKKELCNAEGITGRRSPHVLRHTLATGLMNEGSDLNSIKEMLGHSSLATTQIYTHADAARLKAIYKSAHPRAKKGGNNGD